MLVFWHSASFFFTEKKEKPKKETPSDPSDGVLDLLGQLTLQSSSTQTQTSNSEKTEVIVLDTPQSHRQLQEKREICSIPSRPLSRAESHDAASPSVSAVIGALHLSDIDWDTLSFTSSPASQAETTVEDETQGGTAERAPSSDVRQADSRPAAALCSTECPLRDRVLMRNTAAEQTKKCTDVVSKRLDYELTLPANVAQGKRGGERSSKVKEPIWSQKEPVTNKSQTHCLKEQQILLQTHDRIKEESNGSKKPPQKYKFVRTALSSSLLRCRSDPDQSDGQNRSIPPTTKKSVCTSLCSSSEDSDAENQPSGPRRQTKPNKIKSGCISDFPLQTVSNRFTSVEPNSKTSHKLQGAGSVSQSGSESKCQDVQPSKECDEAFLQTPASPVVWVDDSVICSDSPLPLAERLRLKLLKWAVNL